MVAKVCPFGVLLCKWDNKKDNPILDMLNATQKPKKDVFNPEIIIISIVYSNDKIETTLKKYIVNFKRTTS